ncbi:unnamed protein product [Alopecurus aequalis]
MEPLADEPPSQGYYKFIAGGMDFNVTVTLRASIVESWIRNVKKLYMDAAPIKCVGLDCEFTDHVHGRRQDPLPTEQKQRDAILQLSVASETLVFHICRGDVVPQLLKDFLRDETIRFCGAAIHNDVRMLIPYGIEITYAVDLQTLIVNPTNNPIASLYALANHTISTNLEKKKKNNKKKKDKANDEEEDLTSGWGDAPLSLYRVKYAALDARLGFEIVRKLWDAPGYIAM